VEDAKELITDLIQSLQSEPSGCEGANGRNPEQGRVAKTTLQSAWQVLKVALLFPILGKGPAKGPFSSEAIVGGRSVG
jgi:hypothetical protein